MGNAAAGDGDRKSERKAGLNRGGRCGRMKTGNETMDRTLERKPGRIAARRRRTSGALAPIVFDSFTAGGQTVRRKDGEPIAFAPALDPETWTVYLAGSEELGVSAVGETRRELAEDLAAQLRMVWEDYALADDSELAADALILKRRLLSLLRGE